MTCIQSLRVFNFKKIHDFEAFFSADTNYIIGGNGLGKTSLIEALAFISIGRSFLNTHNSKLIAINKKNSLLIHRFKDEQGFVKKSKLLINKNEKVIKINQQKIKQKDLFNIIPIRVVSPEIIQQIIQHTKSRRNFIDWGLFQSDPLTYPNLWGKYKKTTEQINCLIKQEGKEEELEYWLDLQSIYSFEINEKRQQYLEKIHKINRYEKILSVQINTKLDKGYPEYIKTTQQLKQLCCQKIIKEKFKKNIYGAHRANFKIINEGLEFENHLSRGEKKQIVLQLFFLQIKMLQEYNKKTILMIDDLYSELDEKKTINILESIPQNHQIFITGIKNTIKINKNTQAIYL